jgi:hypothetical protein
MLDVCVICNTSFWIAKIDSPKIKNAKFPFFIGARVQNLFFSYYE